MEFFNINFLPCCPTLLTSQFTIAMITVEFLHSKDILSKFPAKSQLRLKINYNENTSRFMHRRLRRKVFCCLFKLKWNHVWKRIENHKENWQWRKYNWTFAQIVGCFLSYRYWLAERCEKPLSLTGFKVLIEGDESRWIVYRLLFTLNLLSPIVISTIDLLNERDWSWNGTRKQTLQFKL